LCRSAQKYKKAPDEKPVATVGGKTEREIVLDLIIKRGRSLVEGEGEGTVKAKAAGVWVREVGDNRPELSAEKRGRLRQQRAVNGLRKPKKSKNIRSRKGGGTVGTLLVVGRAGELER